MVKLLPGVVDISVFESLTQEIFFSRHIVSCDFCYVVEIKD